MRTANQILIELVMHILGWAFTFGLIYWLATDNLWLCFFVSSAIVTAQFAMNNTKREILESLLPMTQNIDDNMDNLHERTQNLESEVEELKELVAELQSRLDEVEND